MAIRPIEILINARDNASGVFDRLSNKLKVVGVAVAGYFGIKAFAGVVEGAAEFEQALSRVQAATGASAEEMQRLKKAAEDAGANTKFTSTEAAAALENLAKAGLSAGDAIETLPAVLALAQAGDIELATSAEYVTKAVMGMGLAFSDAGRVADVLAMGANATNTSVEGLAQALSYAAPTAASLGVSLEGTVAIIGKFADAGIDASRAGTALNSVMSQFSDPASKFRQELGAIGITTGNFEQALKQLAESGARGSKAINAVGLEAGPALKALLNQGMPALDALKAKLEGAAGSAAATAKVMEGNLKGAMNGLASAWDTVSNVLGTPVLPVLKDAVDQLAGAFRSAVSDGTVQKFGEAIAAGFQSGITWARAFLAEIDFTQLAADLRAFADRTGEAFTQLGEYATNAGNIVKTVYGVMSAGTNAVLGAVYGIGEAFAGVASNIQSGLALLYDAFAKVTFGNVSAAYKQAADEIRLSANATMAAAEELGKKSTSAFLATADGAQLARDGFSGLASAATTAAPAVTAAAKAQAEANKEMEAGAAAAAAYGAAQQKKATADDVAKQAAAAHKDAAAALRAEYEKQVALGNWQAAAEIMVKIQGAAQGATVAVRESSQQIEAAAKAAVAYNAIGEAGLRLELAKEKAYEASAKAAGNEYAQTQSKIAQKEIEIKIVEATAKAMAEEAATSIRVAEAKMAEAKASKDGLSPELEAELTSRINLAKAKQLDAKATAASADAMRSEVELLKNGTAARDKSTAAIDKNRTALEKLNDEKEREISALEKANSLKEREEELERKKRNVDKDGFVLDKNGGRLTQSAPTEKYVFDAAKSQGLDEATAIKLVEKYMQNGRASGWQSNNPNKMDWFSVVNKAVSDEIVQQAKDRVRASPSAPAPAPQNTPSPVSPQRQATTTVNITVEGTTRSINTDAQGAATLNELVRQLAQAKGAAVR